MPKTGLAISYTLKFQIVSGTPLQYRIQERRVTRPDLGFPNQDHGFPGQTFFAQAQKV